MSKIVGKEGVFLGLASLRLGISLGLRLWEIPQSSPARPWKKPSVPPLFLRLSNSIYDRLLCCFSCIIAKINRIPKLWKSSGSRLSGIHMYHLVEFIRNHSCILGRTIQNCPCILGGTLRNSCKMLGTNLY